LLDSEVVAILDLHPMVRMASKTIMQKQYFLERLALVRKQANTLGPLCEI
jgi:hypothetical protein